MLSLCILYLLKNGGGWIAKNSIRGGSGGGDAAALPKFTPSKATDFGQRAQQQKPQPMVWKPPSSLQVVPNPPFAQRPVSAPPYRGDPFPVAPDWNHDHDNHDAQQTQVFSNLTIQLKCSFNWAIISVPLFAKWKTARPHDNSERRMSKIWAVRVSQVKTSYCFRRLTHSLTHSLTYLLTYLLYKGCTSLSSLMM